MSNKIVQDSLMAGEQPLLEGEIVISTWGAEPAVYWRNHLIMAALFSVLAMAILWFMDNPHPWVGPLAAVPSVFARAAYLKSEAFRDRWRLVGRNKRAPSRIMGPRAQNLPLGTIKEARPLFGDVLLITHAGDKHLIKYPKDPQAIIREINQARGLR